MVIPANMQVLYIIWNHFSMWIQWWCPLCDWSDHIWQYWQIYKCYISSKTVFQCEFNGDVRCVIGVTRYGNIAKYTSVIYHLKPFFDVNSMVMSVVWSKWPYMVIPTNIQVLYIIWNHFSMSIQWWCPLCD